MSRSRFLTLAGATLVGVATIALAVTWAPSVYGQTRVILQQAPQAGDVAANDRLDRIFKGGRRTVRLVFELLHVLLQPGPAFEAALARDHVLRVG